jgi:hypothetical protein
MATVKGLGVVFGQTSTGVIIKTVADATPTSWDTNSFDSATGSKGRWRFNSQGVTKAAETVQLRDEAGATIGQVISDKNQEVSLTCYPTGSTLAKAKAGNVLPKIGDRCIVKEPTSGNDADIGSKSGSGYKYHNYLVTSASKSKSQTDVVSFDVTLQRWDANNETTHGVGGAADVTTAVQNSTTIA